MNRKASALPTLLFLLALAISAFGQMPQMLPSPPIPSNNVLGPQLIVWSQTEQPQPVPQPLPDPPEQQSKAQPAQADTTEPQPATQTFAGTIMKDGSKYVLKQSGGKTLQLDDQDNAKKFDGKQVKIVGTLDSNSNTVHIASIQLMS